MIEEFTETDVTLFLHSIKKHYGYDFTTYAKASLQRRINRFMIHNQIQNIKDLRIRIESNEAYFQQFLLELTVNVTEMFRDPEFFKALRTKVVPHLNTYPHIRIWDAGCSSGEEAYSLSILLKEEKLYSRSKIYATDINQKVLSKAKEGIYPIAHMKEYSRNYQRAGGHTSLSDYYHARYNNAIMDDSLKSNFIFSTHNLATDGPFNEFNLILCRNVLIYFQKELQEKVIELFMQSLPVFGYLALGNKESLTVSQHRKHFEIIDSKEKIYRRIS